MTRLIKKNTAIIILAYADFESLEISLACHAKFMDKDSKIFILQNGRGTYDCERTYNVAKRYETLYPNNIVVVDDIPPQKPYYSISQLLNSDRLKDFDYICKLDDDVFPITDGWFEHLCDTYVKQKDIYGASLGYVTSLVNNNPWGAKRVLEFTGLYEEYINKYSRDHYVGFAKDDKYVPIRFVPKGQFDDGGAGSIWKLAYLARWIHNETTLKPEQFISSTVGRGVEEVSNNERYSINCMLFEKDFWNKIDIGSPDDEHQTLVYCKTYDKKIIADLEVPMVHLFFYPQRNENKDLINPIREYYQKWLDLSFPISICPDKLIENENRLRYLETGLTTIAHHMESSSFSAFADNAKYVKYKILSKITFGKTRMHYKEKRNKFRVKLGK